MSGGSEQGGWLPPSEERPKTDPFGRDLPRAEAAPSAPSAPAGPERAWGPGPSADGEPVEYVARMQAAVVDFFVRFVIGAAAVGLGAIPFAFDDDVGAITFGIGFTISIIATQLYAPVMMARTGGQTVGHKAAHTRIVNADGTQVGFGKAFVREVLVKTLLIELAGGLFTIFILPLVNYLWPLWDKQNDALHDKIASTHVVRAE